MPDGQSLPRFEQRPPAHSSGPLRSLNMRDNEPHGTQLSTLKGLSKESAWWRRNDPLRSHLIASNNTPPAKATTPAPLRSLGDPRAWRS